MRNRHFPRVCSVCHAPMARQEDACWRCGSHWSSDGAALRLISGGASPPTTRDERAVAQARIAMDRWITEGGSAPLGAAAVLGAAIQRG